MEWKQLKRTDCSDHCCCTFHGLLDSRVDRPAWYGDQQLEHKCRAISVHVHVLEPGSEERKRGHGVCHDDRAKP